MRLRGYSKDVSNHPRFYPRLNRGKVQVLTILFYIHNGTGNLYQNNVRDYLNNSFNCSNIHI